MGACDLKLVHVPVFYGNHGLDIHVRTTIRYDYSFIEAAAIKIGDDVLEVGSFGTYALNGVEDALKANNLVVPTIAGFPIYHTILNEKQHKFDIVFHEHENITISTFKDWVSVTIKDRNKDQFSEVSGFLGSFQGELLARNGTDLHNDINAFAKDWQIQPDEEMLFRTVRAPQAPQSCILPSADTSEKRRLGEHISTSAAEEACARFTGSAFKFCVHDVIASGDLDIALSETF